MGLFGGSKSTSTTNVTEIQQTQNQSVGSGLVTDDFIQGNDNTIIKIDEFSDNAKSVYEGFTQLYSKTIEGAQKSMLDQEAFLKDVNAGNQKALLDIAKIAAPDVKTSEKLILLIGSLGIGLIYILGRK